VFVSQSSSILVAKNGIPGFPVQQSNIIYEAHKIFQHKQNRMKQEFCGKQRGTEYH